MRVGIVVTIWNCQLPSFPYYIDKLFTGFAHQDFDGQLDVLFVDNQSSDKFLIDLRDRCLAHTNDKVTFSYVSEKDYQYHFSSMNLGFYILNNHAHYDYFGYSADDVCFQDPTGLRQSLEEFSDPEVALVTPRCDFDNAPPFYPWYDVPGDSRIRVKLGECVNLQWILFSREYMEAYNFRYPDMLTCFGTESLMTYVCAAMNKIWVLCRKATLHNCKLDNKKLIRKKQKGQIGWFAASSKSLQEIFEPGLQFGMGFQGFVDTDLIDPATRPVYVYGKGHDPSLYDANSKPIHMKELFSFIKNDLFNPSVDYPGRKSKTEQNGLSMLKMK